MPVKRASSLKKSAPFEALHVAGHLTRLPRGLKPASSGLVLFSPLDQGTIAEFVIAHDFIDHWRTNWEKQARHSSILCHLVVGSQRAELPLAFAPFILFSVKMPPAFIAAYSDPMLVVLLFHVEVSGAAQCHGGMAL